MNTANWQTTIPYSAIIFDVDGTLSAIEGIDYLAELNHVDAQVKALTATAMGKTGINAQLYKQRLDLVQPTQDQIFTLAKKYYQEQVPDADKVIAIFQRLGKSVYMLSAGILPAVKLLGAQLNIPADKIYAVNIQFDEKGKYVDFDHDSPLVNNDGKRLLAEQIKKHCPTILHIGDGLNDFSTHDLVTRFVGFGGVYYRSNIESLCEFYIRNKSLAALLPLTLTQEEVGMLQPDEQIVYALGLKAIANGEVKAGK